MAEFSFVVFADGEEAGSAFRERLAATGHVHVAAVVSDPERLAEAVRLTQADGLFVDLGLAPHVVLDALDAIPAPRPHILVSGPQDDSQLILRAMKQGAREFFPPAPAAEDIKIVIEKLLVDPAATVMVRNRGPIVAVMGAKGGVGATVVACQLAASLQQLGGRTALVDLNVPLGDVALHFDVQPTYTLADVAREADKLDATYLRSALQPHSSGLSILAAPQRVEDAELVQANHVTRVLSLLAQDFDWVIVDVSRSWNESSVEALDLAQQILLVTLLDVPTLNHARKHLDLLKRLGHSEGRTHVVANRYSTTEGVAASDLVEFLGAVPGVRIPNDYATTVRCVNEGKTVGAVSPGGQLALAYAELARNVSHWCGVEVPEPEEPASLLTRIRRVFERSPHGVA